MATVIIPKNITGCEELIIIPRKEYEQMKKQSISFAPIKAFKILNEGLREYKQGKTRILKSL